MITLSEWIKEQGFLFNKRNIRPWGSYELVVSLDNIMWVTFPRIFGYGFTPSDAFELVLTENAMDTKFRDELKSWMGEERFNKVSFILGNTKDVPKYLHK